MYERMVSSMKKKIIISVFILSIIIIGNVLLKINKRHPGFNDELKNAYLILKQREFIGKVLSVGVDSSNHFFKTIFYIDTLGCTKTFVLEYDESQLFYNISSGDSIVKRKGEFIVKVLTDTSEKIFHLDYGI